MSSNLITRPLSMGELLDATFRVYRKHFWKLVLAAGGLYIPAIVVSKLVGFIGVARFGGVETLFNGGMNESYPAWFFGIQLLLGLLMILIAFFTATAVIWMADQIIRGGSPGVVESWRAGLQYFLRYLGMILLLALAIFIGMFGLVLLALIPCLGLLIMLGGFVLFFYLYVRLILSPMALIIEDIGPISAFKTAWRVSSGQFWRIAAYGFLLWLLAWVFYLGPIFLMQYMLSSADFSETLSAIATGVDILLNIINVLWTPLYLVALVALYYDLKLRQRPAADIEQRIEALAAEPPPAGLSEAVAPRPEAAMAEETATEEGLIDVDEPEDEASGSQDAGAGAEVDNEATQPSVDGPPETPDEIP